MKKLILGAVAAVAATVSLSSVAEAGWKWNHHHWHNGWHHGFWGGPRIVIRPAYYAADYCFVKKVRAYDDFGNMYIRRVRVCG
jgi:hypothetical protein